MKRLTKSLTGAAGNQRGAFTLIEVMVVMVIAIILFSAVSEVTYHTTRLVLLNAQENVAESGARNVMMRIAEDVVSAAEPQSGGGTSGPFWSQSDDANIYITKHGVDMDKDARDDIACYEWKAPSGTWGTAAYKPGYVKGGVDNGDSKCLSTDMAQITDPVSDIQLLEFNYCRPTPGGVAPGTFTCTTLLDEPGSDYVSDSQCVWQVRIRIKAARIINQLKDGQGPKDYTMTTSVKPRNIYMQAVNKDANKNDIIDCCDAYYMGAGTSWCPKPL